MPEPGAGRSFRERAHLLPFLCIERRDADCECNPALTRHETFVTSQDMTTAQRCLSVFPFLALRVLMAPGQITGPNLLVNPSFEIPSDGHYHLLPGNSPYLMGWTTILDGAEIFTSTDIGSGSVTVAIA